MEELDEVLRHVGVRGMKWGVRRSGQNGSKKARQPGPIKKELSSLKRERQWKKTLAKADGMSTKSINKIASRIQMENDLKRLSRKKNVGSAKSKEDYLTRGKMDDKELTRKVTRLRAKDNLDRVVKEATKEQMAVGKEIVTYLMKSAIDASKD